MQKEDLGKKILYLTQKEVVDVGLSMKEIIDILEACVVEKGNNNVEMPAKIGIHTVKDAFIHAMPCWIPKFKYAGMKWVSGYPLNYKLGFPYINGLLVLNDWETGLPIAIMDSAWITNKRTGAISGLAAKYLARPESETLGILGCGVQGRMNLEALLVTCHSIKKVFAFDIIPENTAKFVKEMELKYNLEIVKVDTQKQAVVDSDIIVTAGAYVQNPNRVIEADWFKEGALALPVDEDCQIKPEFFYKADKYYIDDRGQYEHFQKEGYCANCPPIYGDIGQLITEKVKARENASERIISLNIGMGMSDIAIASEIYKKAKAVSMGTIIPL